MDDTLEESPTETVSEDKNTTLALLTHVLGFFTWIVGPLVIYFVTDDEFAKENAAQAFNWQLMLSIYLAVSFALTILLIGFVGFFVFPLLDVIFCIIAAIKASKGEKWDYPITINIL